MRLTRAMVIAFAAGLAACGSDYGSNPSPCTPSATQICMAASAFNPTSLTVASGTTVTWRNGSNLAHTVTSDAGAPAAFDLSSSAGGTVSQQFTTTGTYDYHCEIHTGMTGTLTVN